MRAQGLVFAVLLVLVSACGSDTKTEVSGQSTQKTETPTAARVSSQDLLGTWTSGCVLDPNRLDIYIKEDVQFDINKVNRLTTSYLDRACSALLYQQNLESTYAFSSLGAYSEKRSSVALTAQSSTGLGLFMGGDGYCGDRHWHLNVERTFNDVSDCGINSDVEIALKIKAGSTTTELNMHECQPRNPRDCTDMIYLRAN
jgi:hypothetical protein